MVGDEHVWTADVRYQLSVSEMSSDMMVWKLYGSTTSLFLSKAFQSFTQGGQVLLRRQGEFLLKLVGQLGSLLPSRQETSQTSGLFVLQELINKAILASVAARKEWDLKPVQDRAQIFFKAADVISGPKRAEVLAKTMIGQVQVLLNCRISSVSMTEV